MSAKDAETALSAAYAGIVDALILGTEGQAHPRWLVTAAQTGDGITTTTIGIARALAARQYDVLVIDANLRGPRISEQLDEPTCPGLVQLIQNGNGIGEVCRRQQQLGDFAVVAAGGEDVEAVQLLSQPRTAEILRELSQRFDVVLIDTPALEQGLDAVALAPHVDGCVLVVRAGKTGRRVLTHSKEQIEQAGGKILGVVLNRYRQWVPKLSRRRR